MTNEDFWNSINDIINDGFTSEGLTKLEEYAEKFSTGTLLYKRFSSSEHFGCNEGGRKNVIASLLAGAEISSDQLFAPEGSFQREKQCGAIQENRIESWAKAAHCWIDNTNAFYERTLGEQIAQGGEAIVYDNGKEVLKTIGLDYFILPVFALDRISLHNAVFQSTTMKVLAFGRNSFGDFVIVVTQPFIQGSPMTDSEIERYTQSIGFKLINPRNWTYATPNIYLSDMHDENVLISEDNDVYVIDCDIRINTPELRAGGIRKLTNKVEFK